MDGNHHTIAGAWNFCDRRSSGYDKLPGEFVPEEFGGGFSTIA